MKMIVCPLWLDSNKKLHSVSRFVSYTRVAFFLMNIHERHKSYTCMRVTAVTLDMGQFPRKCRFAYIYGKVYEKRDLACIIKKYNKNALRLICYNFRTVNAINFLFSTLHTAPFLYGKIHFGVLHLLHVSIATFDTPLGSNPP